MAPITKEPDTLSTQVNETVPAGAKPQPAAAEIPVSVNGARAVAGTDKREPFSENTHTVLVFANGAVIRLSSAVSAGQLLFLTNEQTKKEVVCQVVKSKNDSSVSGYVELEFTEAAPGFWGMRFGSSGPAPSSTVISRSSSAPASSNPVSTRKSLEEKIADTKTKPSASPTTVSKITEPKLSSTPQQPSPKTAEAGSKEFVAAPRVPAQPPANFGTAQKIPTLSEFLTQGATGPELKSEKTHTELSKRTQESIGPPKNSTEFQPKDPLTSLLTPAALKTNPAPGTSTFDFEAEEVKIPAWLEPLARNSSVVSTVPETKSTVTHESNIKPAETKFGETKFSEPTPPSTNQIELASTALQFPELKSTEEETDDGTLTLSGEGPVPNFGSSLALDTLHAKSVDAKRSGKGLIFGVLAAGLLLAVAVGWYWSTNQPNRVSASGEAATKNDFASATPSTSTTRENVTSNVPGSGSTSSASVSDPARNPAPSLTVRPDSKSLANSGANAAIGTSKALGSHLDQPDPTSELALVAPAKKALGKVRLAAPLASHHNSGADNSAADLAPSLGSVADEDSGSLNLLTSKGKQPNAPASPLAVGGNVTPARLLSSVAPSYPQLARTQRISGDVKIDALVDTNGRVSSMKVLSGPALLHQAAMDALRKWKYQPATLNGGVVPMHLTVTLQFKLQ